MEVWHPNRGISSKDAEDAIKSTTVVVDGETYQGRPATIEELASYEAMFFEELGDMILIALGEKVFDDFGECIAFRGIYVSGRELYLGCWAGDWDPCCCFLIVFEKVSASE